MTHRSLPLTVAVVALALAPPSALAGARAVGGTATVVVGGPRGGVVVVQPTVKFAQPVPRVVVAPPSVFPQPVDPWRFWGAPFAPRPVWGRPYWGAAVAAYALAAPGYYASAPVTYVTPAPSVAMVPAPAPAMPTVVEYENGFYELRGDGTTVPYRWVWIPKVPPPPPASPAMAPPAETPASAPAPIAEERPRKPTTVYRWTDDQGVTTYTDRLDRVPQRYRTQAKANPL